MNSLFRLTALAALPLVFVPFLSSCTVSFGKSPSVYRNESPNGRTIEDLAAPDGFIALDLKSANLPRCARCDEPLEGRPTRCPNCKEIIQPGKYYTTCADCGGEGHAEGKTRCRECRGLGLVPREKS